MNPKIYIRIQKVHSCLAQWHNLKAIALQNVAVEFLPVGDFCIAFKTLIIASYTPKNQVWGGI
jgi:hypothetical protein